MDNYEYCARWAAGQARGGAIRILDYGCGGAQTVAKLRSRGIEAYGCDTYFDGGDFSSKVPAELLAQGFVRRMPSDSIPFDDQFFDVVINNFVMEHVPDLDASLREIARVIKPGGVVLSLFPDRGAWLEGHSGIPFLHKFGKGTTPRIYYMAVLSLLGFGARKGRARLAWCRWTCEYLDKWTYFRPLREIHACYGRHFDAMEHIEDQWVDSRFGARLPLIRLIPAPLKRLLVRKFGASAFVCRRAAAGGALAGDSV